MSTQIASSVPTKRLAAAILSTDSSFSLNSYTGWDGVALGSSDFSTTGRGVFRNTANTQIEFFTFDPTTITGPITILARGLDYKGGTTDGVKTKYNWPAYSTLVELGSNPPAMEEDYVDKISSETIASGAVKTFLTSPVVPTGGTGTQAANATDIANAVTGASGTATTTVFGTVKTSTSTTTVVSTDDTRMPTQGQKDGLSATTTPASGNLFVTQKDSQIGAETYAATTGAANTYEAALSPTPAALVAGMTLRLKANFANTGAALLAITGVNATTLGTCTMTIASPGVITLNSHGLVAGDIVKFTTTGALPTGITAGTKYYVIAGGLTSNAFEVSTSLGGSAVNTSGSQSGTHTLIRQTLNITKQGTSGLASGDLASGQELLVIYDGTQWQLLNPTANGTVMKSGTTTRTGDTASGTLTIAHGIGSTPKYVRITANKFFTGTVILSVGTYNGSSTNTVYSTYNNVAGVDTSNVISIIDTNGSASQSATAAIDATNITLTFTKLGSPNSAPINILWEAFA